MKQEMRCLLLLLVLATPALAQLSDSQKVSIDDITRKVLSDTGVPAASIAIVKDGRIVMAQTYGNAKLSPKVPATPVMRFKIGSITQAVHLSRPSASGGAAQAIARRPALPLSALAHARLGGHVTPVALPHFGLSGLLPARLRDPSDGARYDSGADSRWLGEEAARF